MFGIVDARWQRAKDRRKGLPAEAAIRRFRNPAAGETYTVTLQLASPYGNAFGLAVEVSSGVAGAEHVATARPGDVLVLEGHLTRTQEVDGRFANFGESGRREEAGQNVADAPAEGESVVERVRPPRRPKPRVTPKGEGVEAATEAALDLPDGTPGDLQAATEADSPESAVVEAPEDTVEVAPSAVG